MLALRVDGLGSTEDHDAFFRVAEAVPVLARRAPFLGCRLLAISFFRPTGLSQETFEELAVLVKVFDGVGMVCAWALHELVEVVQNALLGLLVHVISRGDQCKVGWSVTIFLVLFAPLRGGALILFIILGLAFVLASIEALQEQCSLDASAKGLCS